MGRAAGGWLAGLGPVGYSSCLFQSSFPVLTNESCSFRGSHLGSHPVYWPGATSDFVSVSDQLCQLSLSRGFCLCRPRCWCMAWPLCLVHVVVLVSPKEARLSWLDELAHALPCWSFTVPLDASRPWASLPQPVQRVIPLPTPRGLCLPQSWAGRSDRAVSLFEAPSLPRTSGGSSEIRGKDCCAHELNPARRSPISSQPGA